MHKAEREAEAKIERERREAETAKREAKLCDMEKAKLALEQERIHS